MWGPPPKDHLPEKEKHMLISLITSDDDILTKVTSIVFYIIVIVISLSIHEFAHAYAAHRMGDDTARNMGRMTLNPVAHIDPLGFLMLLFVGFGWAKPVPVNSRNYRNYRKGEFIVSFAGIFANLMLLTVSALILTVFAVSDLKAQSLLVDKSNILLNVFYLVPHVIPSQLYTLFLYFCYINAGLALFNLIPVFPLDGSHIFDLLFAKLLGVKVIMWMHKNGRYILYGILILSYLLSRYAVSPLGAAMTFLVNIVVKLFALIFGAIF